MKNVRSFIERARQNASNQHLNFVDDRMNFVQQPNMYQNATGTNSAGGVKKSQPYAITVSSASGAAVQNFDVLGASQYLNNAGFDANGNLVIGSVTISSAIPGVTYRDFLYQSMTQPFTTGLTYLQSATANQVTQVVTITTKDSNGTQVSVPIVPIIDPYQNQENIAVVEQEYRIDGFTKLTFGSILANAVLTVRFYPSDNLNPARALSGQPTSRAFGNPNIIRG